MLKGNLKHTHCDEKPSKQVLHDWIYQQTHSSRYEMTYILFKCSRVFALWVVVVIRHKVIWNRRLEKRNKTLWLHKPKWRCTRWKLWPLSCHCSLLLHEFICSSSAHCIRKHQKDRPRKDMILNIQQDPIMNLSRLTCEAKGSYSWVAWCVGVERNGYRRGLGSAELLRLCIFFHFINNLQFLSKYALSWFRLWWLRLSEIIWVITETSCNWGSEPWRWK